MKYLLCSIPQQSFLQTMLLHSQAVVQAATEEADKKERLMHAVIEVLIKYVKRWCMCPEFSAAGDDAFMRQLALASVGYGSGSSGTEVGSGGSNSSGGSVAVSSGGDGKEGSTSSGSSMGLRFETFASFMMLHLIGRPVYTVGNSTTTIAGCVAVTNTQHQSIPAWQWTITTLCNAQHHGQPAQAIALAALARLAWVTSLNADTTTGASASAIDNTSEQHLQQQQQCVQFVRNLLSPTSANCCLKALISSAAQSHPRQAEDGTAAQWGKGIEQILQVRCCCSLIWFRFVLSEKA